MEDISAVEALIAAQGSEHNEPLQGEEQASAVDVMKQMKFIGDKITEVSIKLIMNMRWTKRECLFLNYS